MWAQADTGRVDAKIEKDALEFGQHVRQRGWRLGLLVARCVEPGKGGRPKSGAALPISAKVSATSFAKTAGVAKDTITRYLTTWDRAAADGIVPPRSELKPGTNPKLDFGALPLWTEYYGPRRSGADRHYGDGPTGNEWYTPQKVIESARRVLGEIDLDPASSAEANTTVKAKRFYSEADDGLSKRWRGRVWMNPPYSAPLCGQFVKKLLREHKSGNVTAAIALLNGHSRDSSWFDDLWDYPLCFGRKRLIRFRNPDLAESEQPWVSVVFLYLGDDFDAFYEQFSKFGTVMKDPGGREWQKRFSAKQNVPTLKTVIGVPPRLASGR